MSISTCLFKRGLSSSWVVSHSIVFFPPSAGMQILWSGEELWVDNINFILLEGFSSKLKPWNGGFYCKFCCLCEELKLNLLFITFTWNNGTCVARPDCQWHSQNLMQLPVCPACRKISQGTGTPVVLSSVPFKCTNCRAQNEEKWSQQWWMENFCPSLGKFKLEAVVELCHLSPALLLYGSIRACKLQMGFPRAFMQARLHRSNVCRKQTEKSWEVWAKGIHFPSNTSTLNVIPWFGPWMWEMIKKTQTQQQVSIS